MHKLGNYHHELKVFVPPRFGTGITHPNEVLARGAILLTLTFFGQLLLKINSYYRYFHQPDVKDFLPTHIYSPKFGFYSRLTETENKLNYE